jgi:hypothetical protein
MPAETYPTPRKKEEVRVWIHRSSELTLQFHGAQSYHAFPRMLRSGGLVDARGPEMGRPQNAALETRRRDLCRPRLPRQERINSLRSGFPAQVCSRQEHRSVARLVQS